MFNPKRMIPKLAVAALALTGCGETDSPEGFLGTGGTPGTGGSGGTAGTGGTSGTGGTNGTLAGSLEAFCLKLVDCFPGYYANADACVSGITAGYGLGGGVSSECEAAAISYFQCGAPLTCQELDMDTNSCSDEGAAADQACS
jgi:hypothetical protein